jgi:nitroreductase
LTEKNQVWNLHTPIFLVLIANREFAYNGKENFWATFDLGAAWGFLQLQAQQLGIATHAMGGFRRDALHHVLSLSEKELPVAVVAMGYYGDPAWLPEALRKTDKPNDRREVEASILAE